MYNLENYWIRSEKPSLFLWKIRHLLRDFEILPKVDNKKLTFPSTVTADLVAWQPFDAVNNTGSELSYILVYCGTVCVILERFQKHFLFGIIQNWNPSKKKAKQNI